MTKNKSKGGGSLELLKARTSQKRLVQMLVILLLVLTFSGCDSWESAKNKVKFGTDGISPNETKTVTIDPSVYAPEKFTYYFNNQKEGILTFIKYSDEFIYCSIPDVKDNDLASVFKTKISEKKEVKLLFDKSTSMSNCQVSCVPRVDSKYNTLYSAGIDIKVSDLNTKFCVNEKGVLWFSNNEKEITEIHLFYNEQISQIYMDHFLDIFK